MLKYIEELEEILCSLGINKREVCLIGSASIAWKSEINNNDLEIIASKNVWKKMEEKLFYKDNYNAYSGVLKLSKHVELQKKPLIMFDITDEDLLGEKYSIKYNNYNIIIPYIYIAHKKLSNREKDLRIIDKYTTTIFWNKEFERKVDILLERAYVNGWSKPLSDIEQAWDLLLSHCERFYIFGTGSIGKHVFYRVQNSLYEDKFEGFLVTQVNQNQQLFLNKRISDINEIEKKDDLLLIAVSIQNMVETEELLRKKGFTNMIQAYQFYVTEGEKSVSKEKT